MFSLCETLRSLRFKKILTAVCAAEYNPKGAAHSLKNATSSFHVAATSLEKDVTY
jgi:hypothetical protein